MDGSTALTDPDVYIAMQFASTALTGPDAYIAMQFASTALSNPAMHSASLVRRIPEHRRRGRF